MPNTEGHITMPHGDPTTPKASLVVPAQEPTRRELAFRVMEVFLSRPDTDVNAELRDLTALSQKCFLVADNFLAVEATIARI